MIVKDNLIQNMSFNFSLKIIELYKKLVAEKEFVISKQLLRSGTGVGANVEEAIAAISRREFVSKLSIALKEAREAKYWIRLLDRSQIIVFDYSEYLNDVESIVNVLTKIIKTTQLSKPS